MTTNATRTRRVSRRDFLAAPFFLAAAGIVIDERSVLVRQRTPSSAGPAAPSLIDDLVTANRILAQEGIVDGYGHVSARHDRDPNRFLLARSVAPALVTPEDLIEYDLDSTPVNAQGRTEYLERFIHGEIYRARPDVQAVVHAHAASLVAFSIGTVPLRPVFHMAGFIGDSVPVFDIRAVAGMTNMLVIDSARGRALAQAIGNRPAVLMRGHGVVAVGASLKIAVGRSIYLDVDARIQSQALSNGGPVTYLDPAEAQQVMAGGENGGYERPWELWKKKALGK